MAPPIQKPLVGKAARYEGIYRPHWEIGHIEVRVSRMRRLLLCGLGLLGLLAALGGGILGPFETCWFAGLIVLLAVSPAKERWAPCGNAIIDMDSNEGELIAFEGIVSTRGHYGHKGFMHRTVEILRLIRD
jgi:hypothetical protein